MREKERGGGRAERGMRRDAWRERGGGASERDIEGKCERGEVLGGRVVGKGRRRDEGGMRRGREREGEEGRSNEVGIR